MTSDAKPGLRIHLALFLLSAALIGFQLEQMQLLALLQWYHFAYFIISVALLGFGSAGTCLAIFRDSLQRYHEWLLPLLMFSCAMLMALVLPLTQDLLTAFDFSLLLIDPSQTGRLLFSQLAFLFIFFLGALPLGIVFINHSSQVGSLYCANLVGSGLGGIAAISLMHALLPPEMPAWTALLPWTAGLLSVPRGRSWLLIPGGLALTVIVAVICRPPAVSPSPYKAISRTLAMPGAILAANKPSPLGLVQLITAPAMRHAPGLSLTYGDEVPQMRGALFNNGDWFGAVWDKNVSFLDASAVALPYALSRRNKVLVLEAGTGTDILQALVNGAREVRAVEPHRQAVENSGLFGGNGKDTVGDLAVRWSFQSSRSWLALSPGQYDLICLPDAGSFGGASGLFAMQEQYLLTTEGMLEMWRHLSHDGVIRISAWLDTPPRNSLRLAATIAETMEAAQVNFSTHVAAIRGWDMVTFLLKRSPLSPGDISQVRRFCERLQFDPLFLPGLSPEDRARYHQEPAQDFFRLHDAITVPVERKILYDRYPFKLWPATDNRPFFSQFLRWQSIPLLTGLIGNRSMPYLELGYFLIVAGFCQISIAAVFLILFPLFRLGLPGRNGIQLWTVPFFSSLGLGYMFFEMVLIHALVLYLGHPIYAAAAAISVLLVFSGLGSLMAGRQRYLGPSHAHAAALATLLLLLYSFILQPLLHATIAWPDLPKAVLLLGLIAPPAFIMGMPFPLGLKRLADFSKTQAAWAWGINGSVSVVSTGLATIIAVEAGFSALMVAACAAYALAAFSGWKCR